MDEGILYVCGTPIGNLDDITLRALNTLKEVDLIAAEDTRHTRKLLNHYQIEAKLTSYHEHNELEKSKELLERLRGGLDVALVSDAGMPGISDPGYRLISLLREEGIKVVPIPGPTAMTTALVISGLPTDRFAFEGFLPRKKNERRSYLEGLKGEERTLIFYEAPHRLTKTLADILEVLGDRKIALCRELTKKFEETISGKVSELLEEFKEDSPRGEMVLVVEGGVIQQDEELEEWRGLSILDHLESLMADGLTKKKAIKEVAKLRSLPKNEVYQIATKIKVNI
ncbi:16S rRNA (cytidine1402-2'-O)-methyltransferase [Orenia metallireducens]|jgi:16S rRNA (cytidine1402-2'-O)-methyltransferase|uniref:Ribosomal RNA small subunit methyltransferase I n=1 Tax=Orenia metallireducens TaxID=1413210 RepID=A0A285GYI9_9FIRM|nr:16S rRNA (cytidine(1402)-2'-O)-methyltransferase [Orenia metallireducens]PRX26449.1 16S rRNA (cytidine1402-2'-O)-methyltransferase [Orenia metallireducens]SNY28700.1 16S rRNA (cytidine1402-2'-O)-methyltransferase [Orenia metallireducens]